MIRIRIAAASTPITTTNRDATPEPAQRSAIIMLILKEGVWVMKHLESFCFLQRTNVCFDVVHFTISNGLSLFHCGCDSFQRITGRSCETNTHVHQQPHVVALSPNLVRIQ